MQVVAERRRRRQRSPLAPPLARGRRGEHQMRTIFLRSRRRRFQSKGLRPIRYVTGFNDRNERDEDYPEIEVIGPGNERDGQPSS